MTGSWQEIADGMLFKVALSDAPAQRLRLVPRGPGAVDPPRQPSWDLCDVFWHPQEVEAVLDGRLTSDAQYVVLDRDRSLRKLGLIAKLLAAVDFWRSYKNVMLADDDMDPVGCTVQDMFELFERTGVRIAQPALTPDSHISNAITGQESGCAWRETNFVEIAIPIFTQEALVEYLPLFTETVSGWGADICWSMRETDAGRHLAILDATPVHHGRALGAGGYYDGLAVNPGQEMREILERQGLWPRVNNGFGQQVFRRWPTA